MYSFSKTKHDSNFREFSNPLFLKGRRDLLPSIRRKAQANLVADSTDQKPELSVFSDLPNIPANSSMDATISGIASLLQCGDMDYLETNVMDSTVKLPKDEVFVSSDVVNQDLEMRTEKQTSSASSASQSMEYK